MQGVGAYSVFVDANVWYSRTLRDWFGMLYVTPDEPLFVVHGSEDVLAEVIRNLRKQHPTWAGSRISTIRDQLAGTFEAGRVIDFVVDGTYKGPDPHDAHVHAAAVACGADALVTCNVKDFTWDHDTADYELMHPDDFLVLVDDTTPGLVHEVVGRMCDYWVRARGEGDLTAALRGAGCPRFAERVLAHLHRMM